MEHQTTSVVNMTLDLNSFNYEEHHKHNALVGLAGTSPWKN